MKIHPHMHCILNMRRININIYAIPHHSASIWSNNNKKTTIYYFGQTNHHPKRSSLPNKQRILYSFREQPYRLIVQCKLHQLVQPDTTHFPKHFPHVLAGSRCCRLNSTYKTYIPTHFTYKIRTQMRESGRAERESIREREFSKFSM